MEQRMFNNFAAYFPTDAKQVASYRKDSIHTLIIKLITGESLLWDDIRKTIRRLPSNSRDMTEEECKHEFSDRLWRIMSRKNITQADLSLMTGIPQSRISNYVSGKAMPSFYNLDRIAKALNCSIDEFRYIN